MTSLQESVDCGGCSSRIDSVQCVACCHPQWREMCHGALAEMKRSVVACGGGGGDGGHLSYLHPTIIHASILSCSSFFYPHPPVLYFKGTSCLSLCSHVFFVGFLHSPHIVDCTSQWELLSLECTGWDNSVIHHSVKPIVTASCTNFPRKLGQKPQTVLSSLLFSIVMLFDGGLCSSSMQHFMNLKGA